MRSLLFICLAVAVYSVSAIVDGDQLDHSHRSKRSVEEGILPLDFEGSPAAVSHSRRKRFLLGRDENIMPIKSHFREYGVAQRDEVPDDPIDMDLPRKVQLTQQVLLRRQPSLADQLASQIAPMSEDELRAWVLLLNSYGLSTKLQHQDGRLVEDYRLPVASQSHASAASKVRAARPGAGLEQPENMDNYQDVKFLSKRAKRVESAPLDPQDEPRALPLAPVAKKSIDWSQYFGIDKKSPPAASQAGAAAPSTSTANSVNGVGATISAKAASGASKAVLPVGLDNDRKVPKKLKQREQNESENKEDRKWVLNEFYKNLAMATNIRRKRDTPDAFSAVAHEMKAQGSKILGDALKIAEHNEEPLTPQQLASIKQDIVAQLAKAYDLEKTQEVLQEAGEQLGQLNTNNINQ